jgi:hypothetical protein
MAIGLVEALNNRWIQKILQLEKFGQLLIVLQKVMLTAQ